MRRKILRGLAQLLIGVSASVVLLAGTIHLDQYLLRSHAERLQSDLRSLELRKSTYADARRVIDHWWNHAREEGPCQQYWCDALITLDNTAWAHIAFLGKHPRLLDLYSRIGGRVAFVRASIQVRNGLVWGKSFSETVEGECSKAPNGKRFCPALIGTVRAGTPRHPPLTHPEYEISRSGGCTGCIDAYVTFTPFADSGDVRRLSDINLACITKVHPCATRADILPSAWEQALTEQRPDEPVTSICSQEVTRSLSRQSGRVTIGAADTPTRRRANNSVMLRVEKDLKPGLIPDWMQREYWFSSPTFPAQEGQRYVMYFRTPEDEPQDCLTPATTENLKIVQAGLAEDWGVLHLDVN